MYRDKAKQREANRKASKKYRQGMTEGMTVVEIPELGVMPTSDETVGYPDIIDKLTDPVWRKRLEKICTSFNNSSANKADVYLGVPSEMFTIGGSNNKAYNLVEVCDLVEATR